MSRMTEDELRELRVTYIECATKELGGPPSDPDALRVWNADLWAQIDARAIVRLCDELLAERRMGGEDRRHSLPTRAEEWRDPQIREKVDQRLHPLLDLIAEAFEDMERRTTTDRRSG